MIKKIILLVLIILLTVSVISVFSVRRKKVFFPRENEIKVFNDENIEKKIGQLVSHLEAFPEDTDSMVELGIYFFLKGHQFYDKSINYLYKAWNMGSTDVRIFYYLGCMY